MSEKEYLERLKEIVRASVKLGWTEPNSSGYPKMQLSEVEKCMVAMVDDFELSRIRKWVLELDKKAGVQEK